MNNSLIDWSAHLFTIRHTQYVLMTNSSTLYSVIMHGRGITNDKQFVKRALSCMEEFMILDKNRRVFERLIEQNDANLFFTKISNRRIMGSINDLIFQAKCRLEECQQPLLEVSLLLNKSPMSYLNHSRPKDMFRKLFVQGGEPPIKQQRNDNVIHIDAVRSPAIK